MPAHNSLTCSLSSQKRKLKTGHHGETPSKTLKSEVTLPNTNESATDHTDHWDSAESDEELNKEESANEASTDHWDSEESEADLKHEPNTNDTATDHWDSEESEHGQKPNTDEPATDHWDSEESETVQDQEPNENEPATDHWNSEETDVECAQEEPDMDTIGFNEINALVQENVGIESPNPHAVNLLHVGKENMLVERTNPDETNMVIEEDMVSPILYWDEDTSDTSSDNGIPITHSESPKRAFTVDMGVTIMKTQCCTEKCLVNFSLNDIQTCYQVHTSKDWVLQKMKIFRRKGQGSAAFVVTGKTVCITAWILLHGISERLYSEAAALHDRDIDKVVHRNSIVVRSCPKAANTKTWLDSFIKLFGEYMPHLKLTLLPSALTKYMIYRKMFAQYHGLNLADNIVKKRQFYNVWKESFPEVKIRKEGMFTKCTVCTVTAEERGKTLDKEKRKSINDVMEKHLEIVKRERQAYERHKEKARQDDRYLCICIDGMDQSKTAIPHLTRHDKTTKHLWSLHTHVTGALTHGTMDFGKDALVFINTADLPSDSNLTLNVLMATLEKYARKNGRLPEVLYLQFDNCWRENKNMYVLGFCYMLVALEIVKKVRINFLIVGHTHNDVDQIFSRLAEALRRLVAHTLDDLQEVISNAYEKPPIQAAILDHVYDFKKWLEPHFAGQFRHHSVPHNFKIKRINGNTVLQYRKYTGDKWEPQEGLKCLKTLPALTDIAPWVKPNLEKLDIPLLQADIPKFFYRMDNQEKLWWTKFLNGLKKMKEIPAKPVHWPMMTLATARREVQEAEDSHDQTLLPANLRPIWQRFNKSMQPVTIGSQGKPDKGKRRQVGQDIEQAVAAEDNLNRYEEANSLEHDYVSPVGDLEQYSTIAQGDLVAVYAQHHWNSSPQIGLVLSISTEEETVLIQWYSSSWSGKCSPLYIGGGSNRKPRSELLDIRCILLWDFRLTQKKEALSSATVFNLKKAYRDLGLNI